MELVLDPARVNDRGIETVIRFDDTEHPFAYTVNRPVSPAVGDVLLCASLLPAMALGSDLRIPAPVSADLLENVAALQQVFGAWLPRSRSIRVLPDAIAASPRGQGVASFFSGGVDSFFTVLRNLDRIDTLIFLRGFDIPPDKPRLAAVANARIRAVAAELGKDLVEIDVSGREFTGHSIDGTNPLVPWELYFGSLLASTAHLLAGQVGEVLLPASFSLRDLTPCGSHPFTDHLWGSSSVSIVHDGAETDRAGKIQYLAASDVAMANLRVCWKNPEQEYNCGRCRACVMTMVGLQAAGALGRCTSLPAHLDPAALDAAAIPDDLVLVLTEYYLRALEQSEARDERVVQKLRSLIGDYHRQRAEAYLGPLRPARGHSRLREVVRRIIGAPDRADGDQ